MTKKKNKKGPITPSFVSLDEMIEREYELELDEDDPLNFDYPEEVELDFNSDTVYPDLWKHDDEES